MERLNLNVPSALRAEIRRMARRRKRRESEMARELLASAVEDAKREEFHRSVDASMTPELRRRMVDIADAFVRLHDDAR